MPMRCIFADPALDITGSVGVMILGAICPEAGDAGVGA